MQARGPLMIEHRLIERMIALIRRTVDRIDTTGQVDPVVIDTAVDFIKTYADRTHHGKEEDILFRDLDRKMLSDEDRRMMDELIRDHVFARSTTAALVGANNRYRRGDAAALSDITANLSTLAEFYPVHIRKEDDIFFPASRAYFSDVEEQAMLDEFREFDRKMIHEKYTAVVERMERT